jgi:hypothetical protein
MTRGAAAPQRACRLATAASTSRGVVIGSRIERMFYQDKPVRGYGAPRHGTDIRTP